MRIYKVVKKEESPTILINKVDLSTGFIIVSSNDDAVGIIMYDIDTNQYIMIVDFKDSFTDGIAFQYSNTNLESLMNEIKGDYIDPVEFNFVRVER